MNIAFFCYHPVEPRFYKHVAQHLASNHRVHFFIIDKEDITLSLIKSFGFTSYNVFYDNKNKVQTQRVFLILHEMKKFIKLKNINLIISATSPYVALLSKYYKIPSIGWTDTETATFNNKLASPYFSSVLTPDCFFENVNSKNHITFKGYKELAYLHPNRFVPDSSILDKVRVSEGEKIILMRFSALKAMHDFGLKSVSNRKEVLLKWVKKLEKHARILISMTEKNIGPEFEKYRLSIHPSEYIDLLSFCTLYIGEGTTTASEAGVLGVPWINIQKTTRGYLIDQEEKYDLGFRTEDIDYAFETALVWIKQDDLLDRWQQKREKLLSDKIDVSAFLIWFIENYPESHNIMIQNPGYQERFK